MEYTDETELELEEEVEYGCVGDEDVVMVVETMIDDVDDMDDRDETEFDRDDGYVGVVAIFACVFSWWSGSWSWYISQVFRFRWCGMYFLSCRSVRRGVECGRLKMLKRN